MVNNHIISMVCGIFLHWSIIHLQVVHNPFANHFLTSWDIQVSPFKLWRFFGVSIYVKFLGGYTYFGVSRNMMKAI